MNSNTSRAVAVALMVAGAVGISACGSSNTGGAADAAIAHDGGHPDAGRADARKTDSGKTDSGKMDSAKPDSGETDARKTDSGTSEAGRTDSGKPDSGRADSGKTDASGADAGDAGPDCGAIPPVGKQIAASTEPLVLQGWGLTSDGYAFYEDSNKQLLYVVPAAGGSSVSLGPMTSQGRTFYLNGGKAALFLPAVADIYGRAPLSAWTAASGAAVISTSVFALDSFYYTYDVTQDGAEVVFFATGDGATATLTVSSIDGKSQKKLVGNIDLTNEYCMPAAMFVKDTVVAYYCLAAPSADAAVGEAGVGALTIASFASPAYTQITLVTLPAPTENTPLYGPAPVSPDGTELLVSPYQNASEMSLYPIAGGAPTTVDPNGVQGGFLPTGDIVYSTQNGALIRYSVADAGVADGGGSLTLVTSGVGGMEALSPNGNWLQVANKENEYYFTNLLLASATTPGPLTTLWSPTSAAAFGFTPDSKFETFGTNYSMAIGNNNFDLEASPVSGSGTPTKILTSAGGLAFTTGSKLVVNVNANMMTGSADIEAIDLSDWSDAGRASTLVTQADPDFFYASGLNRIVYSWHCASTPSSGIWTMPAP